MQLQGIQQKIYEIRGQKVMLDFDLAILYDVETKRLNEAVKRNIERFPTRCMFRLSADEWATVMRSQFATASTQKRRNASVTPFAFSEHGITMLASVLRSPTAIQMNIAIVEAFIALKEFAITYKDLSDKLKALERKYSKQFKGIYKVVEYLLQKDKQEIAQRKRTRIGFPSGGAKES